MMVDDGENEPMRVMVDDGSLFRSTIGYSTAAETWKTLNLEKSCNSGQPAEEPFTANDGGGRWRRACGGGRHQQRAHDGDSEDDYGDVRTAEPEVWCAHDGNDGRHRGGLAVDDDDEGPRESGLASEELHEEVGMNVLVEVCVDSTSGLSGERTAEPHQYQIVRLERKFVRVRNQMSE
ncbi:unnamed protein product [Phytophthora fragariaefolia]|uniref:Unnamed protein product n=1 Tax=Phytophthora fragariaefolia TaxID=1490495 RepID=A0A9W7D2S8_9STRA|nr:unnamed protein product [Phytophthora fragariaefolia]